MSYKVEYHYVDCACMHPGCAIRISKDEDQMIWIEFQTYMDKGFWRRLKDAYKVLFQKKPHNWSELAISEQAAKDIGNFLTKVVGKE